MTSQTDGNPTQAGTLAQRIVEILINEDSVTRHRAMQAAMVLLGQPNSSQGDGQSGSTGSCEVDSHAELATFFNRDGDMMPADYAQLCAAYHFSRYGTAAFSLTELRAIAADAGVVVPDRLDMTLNQAARKGKKLFQSAGRGLFRPTAAAGVLFGELWGVKPGREVKPVAGTKDNRARSH